MFFLLSCFVTLLLSSASLAGDDKIKLITENFPPFGYLENGELKGIGPEIVERLTRSSEINASSIQVLPWKRGYKMTLTDPNTALFSMHRISQREPQFYWVGPLFSMRSYLFARSNSSFRIIKIEDIKKTETILVQEGGSSEVLLKDLGFTSLLPVSNPEHQLRMLLKGRASLYYTTDVAITHQLQVSGTPLNAIKPVFELDKSDFYIAFSKSTEPQIIETWQHQLDKIKQTDWYKNILKKYTFQSSVMR